MQGNVKYSVIIPFYNSSRYSDELINSIPAMPEFEIIFVDDKSTKEESERLRKIIMKHRNHRIKYLYNNEKKSAGTCRNIGLEHATGKWIVFADSDDYFTDSFSTAVDAWYESNADIIYFKPTSFIRDKKTIGTRHKVYSELVEAYIHNPTRKAELALKVNFVVPWSKMIRKEYIMKHQIQFDQVLASNDVMFSIEAAFGTSHIQCNEECIYCVTTNRGSLMYTADRAILDARLDVYIRQYHFLKSKLSTEEFNTLHMFGTSMLKRCYFAKQNVLTILWVFFKLVKNQVKIFDTSKLHIKDVKKSINKMKNNEFYRE